MKRQDKSGFTLIELLLVISIVAILTAIAIPAYSSYMSKTRRSDAKAALLAVQIAEEKWRANNTTYTSTLSDLDLTSASPDSYYTISITAANAATYTVSADPTGVQASDSDCDPMTINQDGVKAPAACW